MLFRLIAVLSLGILISACGGGGGGGGGGVGVGGATATGYFRDSSTAGLSYVSGSQTGVTDAQGAFTYEVGNTVTFSVGGITIGSSIGKTVITPIDLVTNGSSGSTAVQNITRFLLMLDDDGNPDNGINILAGVQTTAAGWTQIDFAANDLPTTLTSIISDAATADSGTHTLPSAASAQSHLEDTLLCTYAGAYRGTFSGDDNGGFGVLVDATSGNVTGVAYSELNKEYINLSGNVPISFDQTATFITGDTTTGASFGGQFTSSNGMSGTWQNSPDSGSFSGSRIGGGNSALHRYTGNFSGDGIGLFSFDIDSSNNVTGVAYSIEDDELTNLSGTLSGTTLSITTANGTTVSGTLNTAAGTLSGTWAYAPESLSGSFSGSGCQLNSDASAPTSNASPALGSIYTFVASSSSSSCLTQAWNDATLTVSPSNGGNTFSGTVTRAGLSAETFSVTGTGSSLSGTTNMGSTISINLDEFAGDMLVSQSGCIAAIIMTTDIAVNLPPSFGISTGGFTQTICNNASGFYSYSFSKTAVDKDGYIAKHPHTVYTIEGQPEVFLGVGVNGASASNWKPFPHSRTDVIGISSIPCTSGLVWEYFIEDNEGTVTSVSGSINAPFDEPTGGGNGSTLECSSENPNVQNFFNNMAGASYESLVATVWLDGTKFQPSDTATGSFRGISNKETYSAVVNATNLSVAISNGDMITFPCNTTGFFHSTITSSDGVATGDVDNDNDYRLTDNEGFYFRFNDGLLNNTYVLQFDTGL